MRYAIAILALTCLLGCSRAPEKQEKKSEDAQRPASTAQQMINGFTGKTAVDAGQAAKQTIKEVSAKEKKQINEVLDSE